MPSLPVFESGRRLLIAAGTGHFKGIPNSDLPCVPEELQRIVAAFAALGYERQQAQSSLDPESHLLLDLFDDVRQESCAGDIVVAYYTGHGARDPDRFYLLTHNSILDRLDRTALPAEELARTLTKNSKAAQVLVILDTCYSGAGAAEFAQIANQLAATLRDAPAVFVIAAARPRQEAEQGTFSYALAETLANRDGRLGGFVQPFLAMDDVMETVDDYLRKKNPAQTATWSSANVRGRCRVLPNPIYQPGLSAGLDLESQRAFDEHWVPKARSAELGAGGWYFTGRQQALRELAAWLAAERSDGRPRVVTGGPGSGKSAVLARIITLSDPVWRREVLATANSEQIPLAVLPPEAVVDVAVHARHKLVTDVAVQIGAGLGFTVRDAPQLLDLVEARPRKTVIVIDALDEADDRDQIISRVLRPLAELPSIFLLVGTRPDSPEYGRRFRALGDNVVEIDLDNNQYVGSHDIAWYVERRLLAMEEPNRQTLYRNAPETAHLVAQAVARRARNVFLVAHTTVHALLSAETIVDVAKQGWVETLPTGLESAFSQFLAQIDKRRPDGLSSQKTQDILVPLAFAEGEGLPWTDLWAEIASALCESTISDTDIALVRKHAAPFVVESVEQDRSVYRLYHERVAEMLRGLAGDSQRAQKRIVKALRSRVKNLVVEKPDWARAHPYILRHLAAHASKSGSLEELATDVVFLATADSQRVLQALSGATDPRTRRAYACYLMAFDRLSGESTNVRPSYLQFAARQLRDDELAEIWSRDLSSDQWKVPWAHFLPPTPHRSALTDAAVTSVALKVIDGQPIVLSASKDGTVQKWNIASGKRNCEMLDRRRGAITSVVWGTVADSLITALSAEDGTVHVQDLTSGMHYGEPLRCRDALTTVAIGILDRLPVIVLGSRDGTVSIWDPASGKQVCAPLRFSDAIACVSLASINGRLWILAGDSVGRLRLWDPAAGQKFDWQGWLGTIAAAVGEIDGMPVMVATRGGEIFVKYISGKQFAFQRGAAVTSIALTGFKGRSIIASGDEIGTIQINDLISGGQLCYPLRGHQGALTAVTLGTLNDRLFVISGGEDHTVRVWDPALVEHQGARQDRDHLLASAAVGSIHGRSVIISGGEDSVVRLWDLISGEELEQSSLYGHNSAVISVASSTFHNRPAVISAERLGGVLVWNLESDSWRIPPACSQRCVTSLVAGTLFGRPIVACGDVTGTVRLWDGVSGAQRGPDLREHEGRITSVMLGTLPDGPIVVSSGVDGTIRLWDIRPSPLFRAYRLSITRRGTPLRGHQGAISSAALALFDDQPVVISGGEDNTVRVWDLVSGTALSEPLRGHNSPVTAVTVGAFASRTAIVSGAQDGTIRIWNQDGDAVSTIHIGSNIRALAFVKAQSIVAATDRGFLLFKY